MANWQIICDEVVNWANHYNGPKFHFLFCDPPYHLQEMTHRFGGNGSTPAQFGKDGVFRRMSKGFMGKKWDGGDISFNPETWAAFHPHMHDGAFGAAYAASRNWHRMAVAIEDAGFFIHDTMFLWIQGQGMTKGSRVDRHYQKRRHGWDGKGMSRNAPAISNQAMIEMSLQERLEIWKEEQRWRGHRYGLQTLAPRCEPIIIFQKPWSADVQRDNVIETGAGCMNVDGCRLGGAWTWGTQTDITGGGYGSKRPSGGHVYARNVESHPDGRWPSNFGLVHTPECHKVGTRQIKPIEGYRPNPVRVQSDGHIKFNEKSPGFQKVSYTDPDGLETVDDWVCVPGCPARRLGEMSGESVSKRSMRGVRGRHDVASPETFNPKPYSNGIRGHDDTGTAARYFPQFDWSYDIAEWLLFIDQVRYVPKVGTTEREAGLSRLPFRTRNRVNPGGLENEPRFAPLQRHNDHPTLKPIDLNKWICTLFLPPEGFHRRIMIPFAGVMSESIGALLAGWDEIIAIEMETEYCNIGRSRMGWWDEQYHWGLRDVESILKSWHCQEKEWEKEEETNFKQGVMFDGITM